MVSGLIFRDLEKKFNELANSQDVNRFFQEVEPALDALVQLETILDSVDDFNSLHFAATQEYIRSLSKKEWAKAGNVSLKLAIDAYQLNERLLAAEKIIRELREKVPKLSPAILDFIELSMSLFTLLEPVKKRLDMRGFEISKSLLNDCISIAQRKRDRVMEELRALNDPLAPMVDSYAEIVSRYRKILQIAHQAYFNAMLIYKLAYLRRNLPSERVEEFIRKAVGSWIKGGRRLINPELKTCHALKGLVEARRTEKLHYTRNRRYCKNLSSVFYTMTLMASPIIASITGSLILGSFSILITLLQHHYSKKLAKLGKEIKKMERQIVRKRLVEKSANEMPEIKAIMSVIAEQQAIEGKALVPVEGVKAEEEVPVSG
jgi:hypothetical protein